jgi:hypothetical protein
MWCTSYHIRSFVHFRVTSLNRDLIVTHLYLKLLFFYTRTMYFFGTNSYSVGIPINTRRIWTFIHGQKALPLQKANQTNTVVWILVGITGTIGVLHWNACGQFQMENLLKRKTRSLSHSQLHYCTFHWQTDIPQRTSPPADITFLPERPENMSRLTSHPSCRKVPDEGTLCCALLITSLIDKHITQM